MRVVEQLKEGRDVERKRLSELRAHVEQSIARVRQVERPLTATEVRRLQEQHNQELAQTLASLQQKLHQQKVREEEERMRLLREEMERERKRKEEEERLRRLQDEERKRFPTFSLIETLL